MSSVPAYALRFVQYLDLMLLFGLPLFSWYGLRRSVPGGDPWLPLTRSALSGALLVSAVFGVALTGIDVVFKTTEIMGMPVTELDRASLGWYLFETAAGRAALARTAVLVVLIAFLGWQSRREERSFFSPLVAALAGCALLTLAWNGHAAAGEGASGVLRLAAGIAHLLAAGGWIGAIAAFLIILSRRSASARSAPLQVLHPTLQDFSGPGTVFVGILVVTGVLHYGDLTGWSVVPLFHSVHGKLLLVKLALFAAMLGLAALHRWRVVPRLEGEVLAGGGSRSLQTLRLTVTIEATLAVLIIAAVSILGTLNPHG